MNTRGWDEDILRDIFNTRDQQYIRSIVLSENQTEDELYWGKESTGQYTVRSAYRMLQAQKQVRRQEDQNSMWQKTWRIKAPAKVLNLTWRSLSNCLPSKSRLLQKNVNVEPLCETCRMEEETIEYIFCTCTLAVQCWQNITPQIISNNFTSLVQWWEKVLEVCDNGKRAEVATVCWSLWKARNELIWNKKYTRLNVVIARAKQYLLQWEQAQKQKP